jgi:hypothetical protein
VEWTKIAAAEAQLREAKITEDMMTNVAITYWRPPHDETIL